jgi:hypothetical protein
VEQKDRSVLSWIDKPLFLLLTSSYLLDLRKVWNSFRLWYLKIAPKTVAMTPRTLMMSVKTAMILLREKAVEHLVKVEDISKA